MKKSWNGPPSNEIDSVVSTWWRDRVTFLIKEGRKRDAAALYLEFCFLEVERLRSQPIHTRTRPWTRDNRSSSFAKTTLKRSSNSLATWPSGSSGT